MSTLRFLEFQLKYCLTGNLETTNHKNFKWNHLTEINEYDNDSFKKEARKYTEVLHQAISIMDEKPSFKLISFWLYRLFLHYVIPTNHNQKLIITR